MTMTGNVTIAKTPKPPGRRGLSHLEVPTTVDTPDNLSRPSAGLQSLAFRLEPDLHRAFKLAATMKGMSMKDLFEACFRAWLERYPNEQIQALLSKAEHRDED